MKKKVIGFGTLTKKQSKNQVQGIDEKTFNEIVDFIKKHRWEYDSEESKKTGGTVFKEWKDKNLKKKKKVK